MSASRSAGNRLATPSPRAAGSSQVICRRVCEAHSESSFTSRVAAKIPSRICCADCKARGSGSCSRTAKSCESHSGVRASRTSETTSTRVGSASASLFAIPRLRENPKTPLAKRRDPDSTERMIRPGFLDIESRQNLIELARDGSAAHRLARRANALVLLDDGMSCEAIAKVLLLDDDTIRTWYRLYEEDGIEGLTNFSYEGSACQLSGEQQEKLKAWVATALPRTTRQVGAWIENEFGVVYEGRSGLIALLHRLGLEYHKPNVIPRKLDEEKQKAFIEGYEKLLNSLGDDEAVLFADAVHPTHAARPVGCWAPSQEKLAIEQTSGRQRINIHGAIDLETGQTRMIEALTIDAASTIRLLQSIEALYPMLALIHVFLDNARYHHAKLVQEWLALPGRRIKLHFIPTYCPHLNPIERLWGLMHRNVTHNKCYATCAQFADATLSFLREKVPGNWADLCDFGHRQFPHHQPKGFSGHDVNGVYFLQKPFFASRFFCIERLLRALLSRSRRVDRFLRIQDYIGKRMKWAYSTLMPTRDRVERFHRFGNALVSLPHCFPRGSRIRRRRRRQKVGQLGHQLAEVGCWTIRRSVQNSVHFVLPLFGVGKFAPCATGGKKFPSRREARMWATTLRTISPAALRTFSVSCASRDKTNPANTIARARSAGGRSSVIGRRPSFRRQYLSR